MNYHLWQDGGDVGEFSLAELERRRAAGELKGGEFVWCAGMVEWQPIDSVLSPLPPPVLPYTTKPPATSARKRNRTLLWGCVAAVVVLMVVGGVGVAFLARSFMRGYRQAIERSGQVRATPAERPIGDFHETAREPIVWTTNSLTEAQLQPRHREFRLRQWVEGYRERGDHHQPCDEDAKQLIQAWVDTHYGLPGMTNVPPLVPLAQKVAVLSVCEDPLVLTIAAQAGVDDSEEIRRLERAVKAFENSRHRAYPKFYAAVSLANHLDKNPGRRAELDAQALRWLAAAFTDGSFRPEDQDEVANILMRNWGWVYFQRHLAEVVQTAKSAGEPFQWLACLLEGQQEIFAAWKARGGGWANSVSEEGWRGFREHSAKARALLTQAWELNPSNSLPASRMVYVAMGDSGRADMRQWFDRATTAMIDDNNAWNNFRWGIRPRWGGSLDEMLDLGIAAVDTGRFDTDVPRKLMDVIQDLEAEQEIKPPEHIYGRPEIWPHLQRMYEGYLSAPTQASARDGWRGAYAVVAYFAGKYDLSRRQLEALDWRLWPHNLHGWRKDLSLLPLEVAARTSPLAEKIAAAERLYASGDTEPALKQFSALNSSPGADERTRQFIASRSATLQLEHKLAAGEWVDFMPTETNDPAWQIERGDVKILFEGDVEVRARNDGHLLYCRARLGTDFELRGEFEVVSSTTSASQAGVAFGFPDLWDNDWLSFRMRRNHAEGQTASLTRTWSGENVSRQIAALKDGHNTFQLRCQSGYINASINGTEVLQLVKLRRDIDVPGNQFRVGLGAYNDSNETVIRYRKVQVHKLPSTAPQPVGKPRS